MFQFRQKTSALRGLFSVFTVFCLFLTGITAQAAVVPNADLSNSVTLKHNSTVEAITGRAEDLLDWRRNSTRIDFDIPAGDNARDIFLTLHAMPKGNIDKTAPLMVSLNGGKAIPIKSKGYQFEAKIKLTGARIRSAANYITVIYPGANATDCNEAVSGGWILDYKGSKIQILARPSRLGYQLRDLEPRLTNPMTSPKSVSIIASGSDRAQIEALIAQGIGLRVKNIPAFKIGNKSADIKVFAGTRSDMSRYITNPIVKKATGAVIGVQISKNKKTMEVFLIGDSNADTIALAKAFSHAHLPRSRRQYASLAELRVQMPFAYQKQAALSGRHRLKTLGKAFFEASFAPTPASLNFNVQSPDETHGELVLGLSKTDNIGDDSRIDVALNGQSLGFSKINKKRKTIAFSLPAGSLSPGQNKITITPSLIASSLCASTISRPSLMITPASKLTLKTPKSTRVDLSRFVATGSPFSENFGKNSDVYLPLKSENSRAGALAILAKAASVSGQSWTEASFHLGKPVSFTRGKDTLVLGPVSEQNLNLLSSAPRAMSDAMRRGGRLNTRPTKTKRIASLDAYSAFKLAAATKPVRSLSKSGVAAIYAAPQDSDRVVAIISTPDTASFPRMMRTLTETKNWQGLTGSVSRFDQSGAHMVQASDSSTSPIRLASYNTDVSGIAGAVTDFNEAAKNRIDSVIERLNRTAKMAPAATPKPLSKRVMPAPSQEYSRLRSPASRAPTAQNYTRNQAPRPSPVQRTQQRPAPVKLASVQAVTPSVSLRGRSSQSFQASSQKTGSKLVAAMGMSDFSFDLFKRNLTAKLNGVKSPQFKRKFDAQSKKATQMVSSAQSGFSVPTAPKAILLGLVGLLALMMFGLASPTSRRQ